MRLLLDMEQKKYDILKKLIHKKRGNIQIKEVETNKSDAEVQIAQKIANSLLFDTQLDDIQNLDKYDQRILLKNIALFLKFSPENIEHIQKKSNLFPELKKACKLYQEIIEESTFKQQNFLNLYIFDYLLSDLNKDNLELYAIYCSLFLKDFHFYSFLNVIKDFCTRNLFNQYIFANFIYECNKYFNIKQKIQKNIYRISMILQIFPILCFYLFYFNIITSHDYFNIYFKNFCQPVLISLFNLLNPNKILNFSLHVDGSKFVNNMVQDSLIISKIENIDTNFFTLLMNAEPYSILLRIIKNDNPEILQTFLLASNYNPTHEFSKIEIDNLNLYHLPFHQNNYNLLEISAFLGSCSIFKYLMCDFEFFDKKVSYFAIAGGNVEIIRLCESKKCIFDLNVFEIAIQFNHHCMFDWLLNTKLFSLSRIEKYSLAKYCIKYNNPIAFLKLFDLKLIHSSILIDSYDYLSPDWIKFIFFLGSEPIKNKIMKSQDFINISNTNLYENISIEPIILYCFQLQKFNNLKMLLKLSSKPILDKIKPIFDLNHRNIYNENNISNIDELYLVLKKSGVLENIVKTNILESIDNQLIFRYFRDQCIFNGLRNYQITNQQFDDTIYYILRNFPQTFRKILNQDDFFMAMIRQQYFYKPVIEIKEYNYWYGREFDIQCIPNNEITDFLYNNYFSRSIVKLPKICITKKFMAQNNINLNVITKNISQKLLGICGGWSQIAEIPDLIDLETLNLLILDFNEEDHLKMTPLHLACNFGNIGLVRFLLNKTEVHVNKRCLLFDETPLNLAAKNGFVRIIELLIKHDQIDLNSFGSNKESAFYCACQYNYYDLVFLLITNEKARKCIDYNIPDNEGKTGFFKACENGHYGIVKLLLSFDKVDINFPCNNKTPFMAAVEKWHHKVVYILINSERKVKYSIEGFGLNAIECACLRSDIRMVRLLFSFPKVFDTLINIREMPLINFAVLNGRIDIIQFLIDQGFDINFLDKKGYSPLHFACRIQQTDIFDFLIEKGAKINGKTIKICSYHSWSFLS